MTYASRVDAQERWYLDNIPLKDEVVADVGANVGRLSQFFFDRVSRKGRVVSIEPIPANIKAIEARIRKAGAKRWTVKKCAVSSHDGHLTLRLVRAAWGDNAVVTSGEVPAPAKVVKVACRRLSGLVPDATVVKIDVEGHEYAFLAAALDELPEVHTWALELHSIEGHRLQDTLALFTARGFSLVTAGHRPEEPQRWLNVPIDAEFGWDRVPGTPSVRDGVPDVFKMLHVIARKPSPQAGGGGTFSGSSGGVVQRS